MRRMIRSISIFTLFTASLLAGSEEKGSVPQPKQSTTKFTGAYYWDERDFNSLSLILSTTALPAGFGIWGFTVG